MYSKKHVKAGGGMYSNGIRDGKMVFFYVSRMRIWSFALREEYVPSVYTTNFYLWWRVRLESGSSAMVGYMFC
jgi:hypothetical protein